MEEIGTNDIKKIVIALHGSRGVDFSNYAFSSFRRRIVRYIEINKIRDLEEFLIRINSDHIYADKLISEITVNVTEMFRDPSFWVILRNSVLPKIGKSSSINIWHAACSTGEEVYSMAILLKESGLLKNSRLKATDLNTNVLKTAEKGVYPLKNQDLNNKNYCQFSGKGKLSDYYTVWNGNVQYDPTLIENVDFGCHNLAQDGPIQLFDLILCRNVLIYFNSELQEKVIHTFNNSMSVGSFLAIGSKESIRWCRAASYFNEENSEEKVYRKFTENIQHHHAIYNAGASIL